VFACGVCTATAAVLFCLSSLLFQRPLQLVQLDQSFVKEQPLGMAGARLLIYGPHALPVIQPTVSQHKRDNVACY